MNASRIHRPPSEAHPPHRPTSPRSGFTLVELLVVISIIGILMGIAIPAISNALNTAKTATLRSECNNFEQAIEAYRLKYGDYPPDFSNWDLAQRHYRRVFPEILDNELLLLQNMMTDSEGFISTAMIDRGEALVFAVGGFSSNPQKPFTGTGGPFALMANASFRTGSNATDPIDVRIPGNYQYNSERDNALLDFDLTQLTIRGPASDAPVQFTSITNKNRAESYDEEILPASDFTLAHRSNDLFPVYRYREGHAPYVYFDARTYTASGADLVIDLPDTNPLTNQVVQYNGFASHTGEFFNVVRPMLSNQVSSNSTSGTAYGSIDNALRQWAFINAKTFQVLSPGLDGVYGAVGDNDGGNPVLPRPANYPIYWQYPIGKIVVPLVTATLPSELQNAAIDKYNINSEPSVAGAAVREAFEKDNVANFTNRSFEDDLE